MLRKRYNSSTISSSKEALMAEYREENRRPVSSPLSLFTPTRLFTSFTAPKGGVHTDSETLMSPTSILDSNKSFSAFKNPFWSDPITPKPDNKIHNWQKKLDVIKGVVGLGLIDVLTNEKSDPKPISPMVLFGSQLKIQVPIDNNNIKTKKSSQMGSVPSNSSGLECSDPPPRNFSSLSISEMELSEEYTCVVSRGSNPKTTHIFDDCVVERCYGDHLGTSSSSSRNEKDFLIESSHPMSYLSTEDFLSFCYNCKKNLSQGQDIYMYRGEKAFCSIDCRYKEMMREEEESDDLQINRFP